MYNKDLSQELTRQYGVEKMIVFSEMLSSMYHLMAENANEVGISSEYEYECDWWMEENKKLKSIETCNSY